jgi:uncharacterized protein YrrD
MPVYSICMRLKQEQKSFQYIQLLLVEQMISIQDHHIVISVDYGYIDVFNDDISLLL